MFEAHATTASNNGRPQSPRRRLRTLKAEIERELVQKRNGAVSATERALVHSLASVIVHIEETTRALIRGGDIDGVGLSRLIGQQTRLARRLGLAEDPIPPKLNPRTGRVVRMDRGRGEDADDDDYDPENPFGQMGEYWKRHQQRTAKMAARLGFDLVLCDSTQGGRLDEFQLRKLEKAGDLAGCCRMIAAAKATRAEILALAAADAADDGDDANAKELMKDVRATLPDRTIADATANIGDNEPPSRSSRKSSMILRKRW